MGYELLWVRCDFMGFHYIAIAFLNEIDTEWFRRDPKDL